MGIVDDFKNSIQGILAVGIVLPVVIAAICGVEIAEWLQTLAALVAGYYFATKNAENVAKRLGKSK